MNAKGPKTITAEELEYLEAAANLQQLRDNPAFKTIMRLWNDAISQALADLENNTNPRLNSHYVNAYKERKLLLTVTNHYMDDVVSKRRDAVRQLLADYGFDEERIERNIDVDLGFLNNVIGGPNGRR